MSTLRPSRGTMRGASREAISKPITDFLDPKDKPAVRPSRVASADSLFELTLVPADGPADAAVR